MTKKCSIFYHVALVLLCSAVCSQGMAMERRMLEAGEFDGLKRFPFQKEDETGWYAHESNCRHYGAGWEEAKHSARFS